MSTIEKNNFVIEKGTDFSENIVIINNSGQPVAFGTTATGSAKIAKFSSSANVQSFVVGITTGSINISMASTITALLESGRNYYDVIVLDGTIAKKVKGTIIVNDTLI